MTETHKGSVQQTLGTVMHLGHKVFFWHHEFIFSLLLWMWKYVEGEIWMWQDLIEDGMRVCQGFAKDIIMAIFYKNENLNVLLDPLNSQQIEL